MLHPSLSLIWVRLDVFVCSIFRVIFLPSLEPSFSEEYIKKLFLIAWCMIDGCIWSRLGISIGISIIFRELIMLFYCFVSYTCWNDRRRYFGKTKSTAVMETRITKQAKKRAIRHASLSNISGVFEDNRRSNTYCKNKCVERYGR